MLDNQSHWSTYYSKSLIISMLDNQCPVTQAGIHTTGCYDALKEEFNKYFSILIGIASGIAGLQNLSDDMTTFLNSIVDNQCPVTQAGAHTTVTRHRQSEQSNFLGTLPILNLTMNTDFPTSLEESPDVSQQDIFRAVKQQIKFQQQPFREPHPG
ncbi:unnamed protein product [Mytilus coruscus]|uniref:Uncharacterized protein n=1 Tax=Mytilus coruscus TaxID=42192 RepID=A0A6J8ETE3_MYTCO|nr:unnamed protein product [Mytilus coruscus]